jgi:hypothetical protein
MEGQRRPGTLDTTVKNRASRARYEYAGRNGELCEGNRKLPTIGIGETESNYRTKTKGLDEKAI